MHLDPGPPAWLDVNGLKVIYDRGQRKVYRINYDYILKRVPHIVHVKYTNAEAATHEYVRERTDIPVPEVYRQWLSQNRCQHYLLVSYIHGETLASAWSSLSKSTKKKIAAEVADYMATLSTYTTDCMQTVCGHRLNLNCFVPYMDSNLPAPTHLSGRWQKDDHIFGAEFRPALKRAGVDPDTIHLVRKTMPPCEGSYVLTHGDLYAGNIMVDKERGEITGIIDWEYAGYWPQWFQYARITFQCSAADGEWKRMLGEEIRSEIPHAEHGRVWWEAVRVLLKRPGSNTAREWLNLVWRYQNGKASKKDLRNYDKY